MNECDLAAIVQMRMCVVCVWLSVGGPACMADAKGLAAVRFIQDLLESADPAAALGDSYRTAAQQSHAGRVVTAIFQPFQSLCEDRLGNLLTEICNYATQLLFTIGNLLAKINRL